MIGSDTETISLEWDGKLEYTGLTLVAVQIPVAGKFKTIEVEPGDIIDLKTGTVVGNENEVRDEKDS